MIFHSPCFLCFLLRIFPGFQVLSAFTSGVRPPEILDIFVRLGYNKIKCIFVRLCLILYARNARNTQKNM